jgi:hypothetical protein
VAFGTCKPPCSNDNQAASTQPRHPCNDANTAEHTIVSPARLAYKHHPPKRPWPYAARQLALGPERCHQLPCCCCCNVVRILLHLENTPAAPEPALLAVCGHDLCASSCAVCVCKKRSSAPPAVCLYCNISQLQYCCRLCCLSPRVHITQQYINSQGLVVL